MCLVIDRKKDYYRACKGFVINGIHYSRLLGTSGGIKTSTIVFVNSEIRDELRRRIDNGRDMSKEMVPAKLEAYQALVCSGSSPVSMPKGVAVVNDCITHFLSDVIFLNDENDGEPEMSVVHNADIELDESDGCGIMLPSLAARWSKELGLDYVVGGVNTRLAFEKGMVFCFDFLDFADSIAHTRVITDAWGHQIDLSNVELILTTSMVKLWDSYESCEHYIRCCEENHYTFSITKTAPKELENVRSLNYQFIQSYDLDDDDIEELIAPTIQNIKDILTMDYRKTILFLKGSSSIENTIENMDPDYSKALMIEPRMMNDPYLRKKVHSFIKQRIDDAKIGSLLVRGNYSIVSGDPFSLCQSMFGMEVTGILKAGEIYNAYWNNTDSDALACFRAPMTCHNNIRKVKINRTKEACYWYKYIKTCTIFNSWDTAAHALNGLDKDGDLVFLTNNAVLVRKLFENPAIMCVQRKAAKKIVTEDDIIESNIASFGDEIGKVTNRITSMFEVQARYPKGSKEYEILDYRIKCGQLFQQNSIDKAKGIIAKPMPKTWYDWHSASDIEDPKERSLYLNILAERKPYFMRYIYPDLMLKYNEYIENTSRKSLRLFRKTIDELIATPSDQRTYEQNDFIRTYFKRMPVGVGDCVMNKICRRIEKEFDKYLVRNKPDTPFDYSIMKSGQEYSPHQYYDIVDIYKEYNRRVQSYMQYVKSERIDEDVAVNQRGIMIKEFKVECRSVCSNRQQLCDIILDICYSREGSKQFAWDVSGEEIIDNLLNKNDRKIKYPVCDKNGEVEYLGDRFSFRTKTI